MEGIFDGTVQQRITIFESKMVQRSTQHLPAMASIRKCTEQHRFRQCSILARTITTRLWDGFTWETAKLWDKLLLRATRFYVQDKRRGHPMQEFSINGPFGKMDFDDGDYFSYSIYFQCPSQQPRTNHFRFCEWVFLIIIKVRDSIALSSTL